MTRIDLGGMRHSDPDGAAEQVKEAGRLRWEEQVVSRFKAKTPVVEVDIRPSVVCQHHVRASKDGVAGWETLDFKPPAGQYAPHGDTGLGLGGMSEIAIVHMARLRANEIAKEHGYRLIEDGAFTQKFERAMAYYPGVE